MAEASKKPKRSDFETPEGAFYLTSLYRDYGMTDEQVANKIGVTRRTLLNWRKASKVIAQATEVGKASIDTRVENALLQQALKGNITAIIFWLSNRKPDYWKNNRGRKDDTEKSNANNEQSKAIADMINTPAAERVLADFLGVDESKSVPDSEHAEAEGSDNE